MITYTTLFLVWLWLTFWAAVTNAMFDEEWSKTVKESYGYAATLVTVALVKALF